MQELIPFHKALSHPSDVASQIPKKIIGYMCSYAPEELIYAAGFHPFRLFSSKSDITLADNHLQAYCCSLVRGVLEDSLSGRLDYLYGAVFPHTCDTIQRLSDIWRLNTKFKFFADITMPVKLNTRSARTYMKDVLIKFKSDLEKETGKKITDTKLSEAVTMFNTIRKQLQIVDDMRAAHPGILKGSDMHALVKGAMTLDRDEIAATLPRIVDKLKSRTSDSENAKRLVLSGSICDSPDIYSIIESAGAVVVGDDLCTGHRWYDGLINENKDPMEALTDRYVERIICPAKHHSTTIRGETLLNLAKNKKADGIVFMLLKFCDPHGFDHPYLKEFLDKHNFKNMLIEMDDQAISSGQLSTRIETFIHMI